MKFNCTSPCKNCPYRTDAPLRLWARGEFRKLLEHNENQFGMVYNCHKGDDSICRGYLMDQDQRNHPNVNLRMMLSKYRVTRTYLDALACPSPMYASIEEMVAANFPDLLIEQALETSNSISSMSQVKCTRCRHVHSEADRQLKKRSGASMISDTTCPKCGCKSYQRLSKESTELSSETPADPGHNRST